MSCPSLNGNVTYFSRNRADAWDIVSADPLENNLQWYEQDVALDAYFSFLEYTLDSDEGDRVAGSTAHLAFLDAWTETLKTY